MNTFPKPVRILSIDPGIREIGYVVFEGEYLIRYGVKNVKNTANTKESMIKAVTAVRNMIDTFHPDVLVLGKLTHPALRENPVITEFIAQVKISAKQSKVKVREYDPGLARRLVTNEKKPRKIDVSILIAKRYPELLEHVPKRNRLLWNSRDFYWQNMFDACTLALAYLESNPKGKGNHKTDYAKRPKQSL